MGETGYVPYAKDEKAHTRMVLDCCWSHDGQIFATASRDKSVRFWGFASVTKIDINSMTRSSYG